MIGLKNEFAMRYPFALLKNWNLQHANFDVLKLPVLEVCFTPPARYMGYVQELGKISNALQKLEFTTCEFWCSKTACFGGMFLHPPQWLCVSMDEVSSGIFYELPPSQHTTNEQHQNCQQQHDRH